MAQSDHRNREAVKLNHVPESYVYLSYADPVEKEEAMQMIPILRDLGYRVRYRHDGQGVSGGCDAHDEPEMPWTEYISDSIDGAEVYIRFYSDRGWGRMDKELEWKFAQKLGRPILTVDLETEERLQCHNPGEILRVPMDHPDFSRQLQKALEHVGEESGEHPEEGEHDFFMLHYPGYATMLRSPDDAPMSRCNLRTHEDFDAEGNLTGILSLREICIFKEYMCYGYRVGPKSERPEYEPTDEDREVRDDLCQGLRGTPNEISVRFNEMRADYEAARSGYPYMDEFEYIDSLFD